MTLAEPRQPFVVDAYHLDGGLGVVEPGGGAQDPVQRLGLHAVAVLVLQAELRVAQTVDALLAILVEAGGGHAIGAMDLPRDVLATGRAHAAGQAEEAAVLAHPHLALRTVGNVGHAVLQRRRCIGRKQVGRQLAEVDVAVGGDSLVVHRGLRSRSGWGRQAAWFHCRRFCALTYEMVKPLSGGQAAALRSTERGPSPRSPDGGCLKKLPVNTTELGNTTVRPVGWSGAPSSSRRRMRTNPISSTSPWT